MSEEIIKSLIQLLAIVSKQDNVVSQGEREYVISLLSQDLDPESLNRYITQFDQLSGYAVLVKGNIAEDPEKPLSVKETAQTLAICNKISKSLEQKQKIFMLIKILQLVAVDSRFTSQKKLLIEMISAVFNISDIELEVIKGFVFHRPGTQIDFEEILLVNDNTSHYGTLRTKYLQAHIEGEIVFLKLENENMYFVKYYGHEEIILNGFIMIPGQVYVFSNGSTIKSPLGTAIYFSDLIRYYLSEISEQKLSFNVHNLGYSFSQRDIALHNINLSEGPGKLIGIMGVSGAGKTTLLNVMAGINPPNTGKILINGIDLYSRTGREKLKGVMGFISQDDLLIEELTVFENLYYNAQLCFSSLSGDELNFKVIELLKTLGLWERKDLRVGSVLDKKLSGGQRKRLNIALELIRQPAILFVDEPTSGLSSRDSENVMDLLKELSYRGKLIFVVIHQPSSDIYKMFDRIYILDMGGFPIYYGNPIDAVTHFKRATHQINSDRGICAVCGNVNPEQIFNIIEEKAVDEFGDFTEKRKIQPRQWEDLFKKSVPIARIPDIHETPGQIHDIPSSLKQILIYFKRDLRKKISDKQYLLINLLESPALAFILAMVVRYRNYDSHSTYTFRFNENIPVFIIMSIVVALFFGLMVSAEEIIGDRKILKREAFLHLSRNSYLLSKITLLFIISGIQTLSFVWIGNTILGLREMIFPFWMVLFSVSCFANLLGLNISSAFKNSVTVYILIPLLIIPQMILSGLLVSFDKINDFIGSKSKVPVIADLMTTRWAFEAMTVYQFMENAYERPLYEIEKEASQANYKSTFYIEKLRDLAQNSALEGSPGKEISGLRANSATHDKPEWIRLIRNEIKWESAVSLNLSEKDQELIAAELWNGNTGNLFEYLDKLKDFYRKKYNQASMKLDHTLDQLNRHLMERGLRPEDFKNRHYNEKLSDLVRNTGNMDKISVQRDHIIQLSDPIYNTNLRPAHIFDYRAHFYAPEKPFLFRRFNTFWFNITVIWGFTVLLYVTLYFEVLRKSLRVLRRNKNSSGVR